MEPGSRRNTEGIERFVTLRPKIAEGDEGESIKIGHERFYPKLEDGDEGISYRIRGRLFHPRTQGGDEDPSVRIPESLYRAILGR